MVLPLVYKGKTDVFVPSKSPIINKEKLTAGLFGIFIFIILWNKCKVPRGDPSSHVRTISERAIKE